jgi:hypothetical protein
MKRSFILLVLLSIFSLFSVNTAFSDNWEHINQIKNNEIDETVRSLPEDISTNVFRDPENLLSRLVDSLVKNEPDDFKKVKIIHDWIIDNINYDVEAYGKGIIRNRTYTEVVKNRLAVCEGYAELFKAMCTLAGFEAVTVTGAVKDESTVAFYDYILGHVWNAVKIHGIWYLADITWDSISKLDNDNNLECRFYRTSYLFPRPEHLIYTHLPDDPEYQFLSEPVSRDEFIEQPLFYVEYFDYEMEFCPAVTSVNTETDSDFFITIPIECEVIILEVILAPDGMYCDYDIPMYDPMRLQQQVVYSDDMSVKYCRYLLLNSGDYIFYIEKPVLDEDMWTGNLMDVAVFKLIKTRDHTTEEAQIYWEQ